MNSLSDGVPRSHLSKRREMARDSKGTGRDLRCSKIRVLNALPIDIALRFVDHLI
jgi:hypothetical protein